MIENKFNVTDDFIHTFSRNNQEPAFLTKIRLESWKKTKELTLPSVDKTKITRWNFTSFANYQAFQPGVTNEELPEKVTNLIDLNDQEANFYVQIDQRPARLRLSKNLQEKGVIFTDILTAAKEYPDLFQRYFMTEAICKDEHKLTAFHAALVNGGIFLYVPKNVEIKEPIQAVFASDKEDLPFINHILVVAEDNSAVNYVENYVSLHENTQGIANIMEEVIACKNAQITFGAVDHLAKNRTTYINRRAHIGADSRMEWALGLMNDGDTINENVTNLVGDGSSCDIKSVTVGRGRQTQNITTRVIHHAKASKGTILSRGVMKDRASTIFNGIGHIKHGASKSNAQQETRVLMLSQEARGDANPILLIDENDVVAGHAASVGRVDPLQMFYLMSRGISKQEAERLVIHGFLDPVVSQLATESVQTMLKEVIEGRVR